MTKGGGSGIGSGSVGSSGSSGTTIIVTNKRFDKASITKINGNNFRVWKIRLQALFKTHDIMGVCEGSKSRPTAADADKRKLSDQQNNEAMTFMYLSIVDIEVEPISGCSTSAEIWTKFNTMYQSTSEEAKAHTWGLFYSVFWKEGESAVRTMKKIQNLV